MAGDWIKMRASLCTHPKVLRIAAIIGDSQAIGKLLSTGFNGRLDEIVKRDVTRDITLASLLRVWCAANEHTVTGVWENTTLETLDQVAGIPGFGQAMVDAKWAIYDDERQQVTFPNFLENNAPAKNGRRSNAAERQRKYRERKAAERDAKRDVTHNVTSDVTSNAREEKRRDIKPSEPNGSLEAVWEEGIALLTSKGLTDSTARSFVGMLCKRHEASDVADAFQSAAGKVDPKGYITAILKTKPLKGAPASRATFD